jgi:hypothetical protein
MFAQVTLRELAGQRGVRGPAGWVEDVVALRTRSGLALASLAIGLVLSFTGPSAHAANLVNITINVPAMVVNACAGDVVALSGDLHVVISQTADGSGGYHVQRSTNYDQLKGSSLVTGVAYTAATTSDDSWHAVAPFPATHTHGDSVEYLAQGAVDNLVLHLRTHVTVTATGTPTATVDQLRAGCTG